MVNDLLMIGGISLAASIFFNGRFWLVLPCFYIAALITAAGFRSSHPGFQWETYAIGIALAITVVLIETLLARTSDTSLMTLRGHTGAVTSIDFSPDGNFIASASNDSSVKIWEVQSGQICHTLHGHNGSVNAVSFSPGGSLLASASSDKTIKIWEMPSGKLLKTLHGPQNCIMGMKSLTWNPYGTKLVCACGAWAAPVAWEVGSSEGLKAITDEVNASMVVYSPNGSCLALVASTEKVYLFRSNKLEQIPKAKGSVIAFDPDGHLLAVANDYIFWSSYKRITIWDIESGQRIAKLKGHPKHIKCLAFDPETSFLASGSKDRRIALWDLLSRLYYLGGHMGAVNAVRFSPKGGLLASGSDDNTIKLCDLSQKLI